jgi:hypothetical protein
MADEQAQVRPVPTGPRGERGASWLARGCLVAVLVVIFVIVVVPALLWAAGILFAGGR